MVIGLTGGIGTGKSTVSRKLREKGYPIIDLDVISREVITYPEVIDELVRNFGNERNVKIRKIVKIKKGIFK